MVILEGKQMAYPSKKKKLEKLNTKTWHPKKLASLKIQEFQIIEKKNLMKNIFSLWKFWLVLEFNIIIESKNHTKFAYKHILNENEL